MSLNIYFLTGFMAAGKSTIAPILANTLGWKYFDLDKEIEKKAGQKIIELFKEKGETHFRKIESEILREISSEDNLIISLGGGTLLNPANLEFIRKAGKLVYLKSSVNSIFQRLKHKRDRPALFINDEFPDDENLMKKIEEMMKERKHIYESAEIIIDTDNLKVGQSVDMIAKLINQNILKNQ